MARAFAGPLALLALGTSEASKVTPVEKVVELLKNLEKKIEGEGAEEATAYDKYSCFCKEEADNKQYAIEKSTEEIAKMSDKIDKLSAEITELDSAIGTLATEITNLQTEMDNNQATRNTEHETFLGLQADMANAISAVERAIQALKESKQALGGKAEREALVQVQRSASKMGAMQEVSRLNEFIRTMQPGTAYTYKYHSNDIISTLEGLRTTFKNRKLELEETEFNANSAFELNQQALSNEQKFKKKEKTEKEAVRETKTEEKEATEADKAQEIKEKTADQSFLNVLQGDCETKARLWDQRSQTRSEELTAISEALEALKTGVAPNWKANKKLVGFQQKSAVKGHWVYVEDAAAPGASFLQVRGASLRGAAKTSQVVAHKIQDLLEASAKSLRSPVLAMAALKVNAAEDHFVKVRQIIKDLIAKLEEDAANEATQKSFCDKEMAAAVSKRDSAQSDVETNKAKISALEAEKDQLKRDIAELSAAIAANKKALLEATELREKEKEENNQRIEDAGAGKAAVEQALNVLKSFYTSQGFLQFVPKNSDREGLTVTDKAPEVFDSEYHGSQQASKGILGLLEVILSDFDRTEATVSSEESQAESDFQAFKTANEDDTATKEQSVETKEGRITTIEADLLSEQNELSDNEETHSEANKELEKLHTMCVAGEETYEDRVAARNKEIEALKQAMVILEDWQK